MTKMHAFLMLLFCFLIAAATTSAFISDGTFIKSGKFALNKVKSCMIGTSFKIKVACGSVSISKKNSPQLLASILSSSTLFTLQLSRNIGRRQTCET